MSSFNKFFAIVLVCLVLSSLFVLSIKPVEVYAASKRSTPQFSVKFVDRSYDVPPSTTTTVNPYTGEKTTTTIPEYHVTNKSIEVTIKNQPFTPYTGENGYTYNLYYVVQSKGHYSEDWQGCSGEIKQSDSQYTIITCHAPSYDPGAKLDFRVQAAAGYAEGRLLAPPWVYFDPDTISDWSKPQTLIIPGNSPSKAPSQTTTQPTTPVNNQPNQPNPPQIPSIVSHPLFLLGVGALFAGVVVLVVMAFTKRHLKTGYNNDFL